MLEKSKRGHSDVKMKLTHLMIAVNYFQFQKVTLGGFSEYHCLMDECRPQSKTGSVLQQLLHELFVMLL